MSFKTCREFFIFNVPIMYTENREGSITTTMSKNAIIGQLEVFKDNYNLYNQNSNEMMRTFSNKFANTVSLLYHLENEKDIIEVSNYIKTNKRILKNSKGLKYNVAKLIWEIFGYYNGSKIIRSINYKK